MFSVQLQCKMNIKGSGGKLPLEKSGLWRVVTGIYAFFFNIKNNSASFKKLANAMFSLQNLY